MAQPQLLQDNFTRMIQDLPRDQLPDDAAWYMKDFLPNTGKGSYSGRLAKRGGWINASEDIATDATSATYLRAMGFFDKYDRICVTTNNNKFGYIPPNDDNADFTLVSTSSVQSKQGYVELNGKLIVPANDGTTAPKYYDGTTFGNLAGSPPAGQYATAWKDRLVLGNSTANPNRSWFSALDDATTWDTTNAWVNTINEITGYAPLANALLIFGSDKTARIRGSIPPPGSDFIIDDPLFHVGCPFPMSIATDGALAAFANEEGVWLTNGTSRPQDLTAMCGIKGYWQDNAAQRGGFAGMGLPTTTVTDVCGGFIGTYYLCTIRRSDATNLGFLFNLADRSCVLLSNFPARSVVMTPQIGDELYFGIGTRIIACSPIFIPGVNKQDADSTTIAPILETRFYEDRRVGKKRWKSLYLNYYLSDAASDNPTLAVSYDPHDFTAQGYTTLATLSEITSTSPAKRVKIPIRYAAHGMAFKVAQSNASGATNIVSLSADVHALEAGRVG